jgi:hypothetical protein
MDMPFLKQKVGAFIANPIPALTYSRLNANPKSTPTPNLNLNLTLKLSLTLLLTPNP